MKNTLYINKKTVYVQGVIFVLKILIRPLEISDVVFCDTEYRQQILASISSRDITKSMVRVKSSNIWAYNLNVKDNKKQVGDLYIQFKGPHGGPDGGTYVYYDIPVRVYRQLVSASSKGHAFWQLIRNRYSYSKLTGDKKGKLRNAIN